MASSGKWPTEINLAFAERIRYDCLCSPASVSDQWRTHFDSMGADPPVLPRAPMAGRPSTGSPGSSKREQQRLVERAPAVG